ncbi:MAG: hypothetical protein ACK50L_10325 [Bacteroidota bacterium]
MYFYKIMMRNKAVLIFLFFGQEIFAQDVLYFSNGNKLTVKVTEINLNDIKYKELGNLEGPTYAVSKTEIVLIEYANQKTEIINSNPTPLEPKKVTPEVVKSTSENPKKMAAPNLYYMNQNLLSINALALANGDITLIYDRELFNSKMSISFLGGYNFNSRMGILNFFIADGKENAKKKYDAGLGVNFMPRNTKRVQYFVGLLGKYMAYDYKELINTINNQKIYANASGNQLALMVSNGWIYRISPFFNFKIFGSLGISLNSNALSIGTSTNSSLPKAYLGYCFGYRF